jgi:nucleoside-diphosphate kinase
VERSLVIVKPDGVERGLAGEIVARFERRGLRLVAVELRSIDLETAKAHYAEHDGKPFFAELLGFITRSPALVMVLEGPPGTIGVVRSTMGATNPADATPGTIRGDLATSLPDNLVHGSDSVESAAREIAIYFPALTSP